MAAPAVVQRAVKYNFLSLSALALLLILSGCGAPVDRIEPPDLVSQHSAAYRMDATGRFPQIRGMALRILEAGSRSNDPEVQMLTLFGASLSADRDALALSLKSVGYMNPGIQVAALNTLALWQDDIADHAIAQALGSPFLITRLDAVHHLVLKQDPRAVDQLDALFAKVDEQLHPYFPALYVQLRSPAASARLRRLLLQHPGPVRLAAMHAVAVAGRDDFLPEINNLASHLDSAQQEAAAFTLGALGDRSAVPKLEELARSRIIEIELAARWSLLQIGDHSHLHPIQKRAREGNRFAVALLADEPGQEEILAELAQSSNLTIRLNAVMGLLEARDQRATPFLPGYLLRDSRDLGLTSDRSPGYALSAWKVVPSAMTNFQSHPTGFEQDLRIREKLLVSSAELPEVPFLRIASAILDSQQTELIPLLIRLLESWGTEGATALLEKHQRRIQMPLTRWYCNLALFRMEKSGPYAANLLSWIQQQHQTELIQFRPSVPWDTEDDSPHELTPTETSRLLIESYGALAEMQTEEGINALLEAIEFGNKDNRYVLAGLLLRAMQ